MSSTRRVVPFVVAPLALVLAVAATPAHRGTSAPAAGGLAATAAPVRGTTPPGVPATGGDRAHCAGDRQFGGLTNAPPCQPDWTGRGNSGASWAGVTADTVEIVYYVPAANPVVESVLRAAGGYSPPAEERDTLAAISSFVNKKYELWNRRIKVDLVVGNCPIINPDPSCFNNDARTLVRRYKPFGVIWDTNTNVPTFFQTLSKLGVVSFGGWGFPAQYNVDQAPYHYDVFMDGDTQAQVTGSYWCRRLAGRKASFAGEQLRGATRKAAIITVDIPQNIDAARSMSRVVDACDPNGAKVYTYSADVSTAANQTTALIAQLKRSGVTSVIWDGDPIAPALATATATAQSYFPENVIAGGSLLDQDAIAQLYDKRQWAHAFGPSDTLSPKDAVAGITAIWREEGRPGTPPAPGALELQYMQLMATAVQQAGPTLTPANVQRGILSLPPVGGSPGNSFVLFGPRDYTAVSDARSVAWDPDAIAVNGKKGAYVVLDGGRRFRPGQWPTTPPAVTPRP